MCKGLCPPWPRCFVKTGDAALGEPSTCLSPSAASHAATAGNFWVSHERDIGGHETESSPGAELLHGTECATKAVEGIGVIAPCFSAPFTGP